MGTGQETITDSTTLGAALKTLIPDDLAELFAILTEVQNARDGESTLLAQIDSLQSLIAAITTEITNARDGETNLLAQIDSLQSAIASLAAGSGVKVSTNDSTIGVLNGKLVAGPGVEFTEGNDGGDETLTIDSDPLPDLMLFGG